LEYYVKNVTGCGRKL